MRWIYDDGGREAAGFEAKKVGDCVVRAIAIATGQSYRAVYDEIGDLARDDNSRRRVHRRSNVSPRNGVMKEVYKRYLRDLGWTWTPTMGIGTGCRVHLRDGELPAGRLIVRTSRHLTAVIDGVIHDIYDPSRDGSRCVYGYWRR
jgi:hypothetical protein